MYYKFILFIISVAFLIGCNRSSNYQKQHSIKEGKWSAKKGYEFVIDIEDTNATYQPFLLLRNDDAYPFSNIWVKILIQQPNDSAITDSMQLELKLADDQGNWLGLKQGSIWQHKMVINSKRIKKFPKKGKYTFVVKHMMRQDPLPSVLNIGFGLKKI